MKNSKPGSDEFKSGIFIIISLALLILSILWLRYFAVFPEKKIVGKFTDPGPIETGIPVYYQGINIGKVPKIGYSKDFKYTYIYMDLYQKLDLPANIKAMVKTKGISGQRYVNIIYPDHPVNQLLANGDLIQGEIPFGVEDIQEFLKREIKSGRLKKMFNDIEHTLANADAATNQINKATQQVSTLMTKYDSNINDILANSSNVTTEFHKAALNVNRIIGSNENGIGNTVNGINRVVQNTEAGTADIIPKVSQTLDDTSLAVKQFNCVGKNINNMLGQRFLLFKLMFGRANIPENQCETEMQAAR